jgi:hypothetical protein
MQRRGGGKSTGRRGGRSSRPNTAGRPHSSANKGQGSRATTAATKRSAPDPVAPTVAPPDAAIESLKRIQKEFGDFLDDLGAASESDTRVKLIDRILVEALGWPERAIRREHHVHSGFIDYELFVHNRPFVAVEAKREGKSFVFPHDEKHRSLKLSGALITNSDIRAAIEQVRSYCDEGSIRYAIATNGSAWIVFRAIREDIKWREGTARVFPSLENVISDFTSFWNLLSYGAVTAGRLDAEFGVPHRVPRRLHRVIDRLFNADLPLQRNRLHAQLYPLIRLIFEDIAEQGQAEVLQRCYVHSRSLRVVAEDINTTITDTIPRFLRYQGAEPLLQNETSAGSFGTAVESGIAGYTGQLLLLLGGIGSGKTTFLKRYQRTVAAEILKEAAVWFHVDFLGAPLDPLDMEPFVWREILNQLRSRYDTPHLETRRNIKRIFKPELEALHETALNQLAVESQAYDRAISPYLEKWQADLTKYVPLLLRLAKPRQDRGVVVFMDNVDQLAPEYQAQIFLLAQRVTRMIASTTVVALREESYYTASIQKTFTAYTSRKFHIASPHFRRLIGSRIEYALELLRQNHGQSIDIQTGGIPLDVQSITNFLSIVEYSIFEYNENIARFIEAICFGNMRLALQMFTTFMTSGATDVDKMLSIYGREGSYYVAFHEFVKSIMLGDRSYYRESQSPIMNLFECGAEKNASHFTTLRILMVLLEHRGETNPEGRGYVETARVVSLLEDVFDNREAVIWTLDRLIRRELVETNTRSTSGVEGSSHIRVTSAGWYYARHLVREFSYLALVLQDTPFDDLEVQRELRESMYHVGNIGDREEDKLSRMEERFARVERFLDYLEAQEEEERTRYDLNHLDSILAERIVPKLRIAYERQSAWIGRRLRENREKLLEAEPLAISKEEIPVELEQEYDAETEGAPEGI